MELPDSNCAAFLWFKLYSFVLQNHSPQEFSAKSTCSHPRSLLLFNHYTLLVINTRYEICLLTPSQMYD